MNVLMVVSWDNIGGVSSVVNNVATSLKAEGHGVHFLFPNERSAGDSDKTRLGFPAHYLNLRPTTIEGRQLRSFTAFALTFPSTVLALQKLIRELKIDVVNVHCPGDWGLHFLALRKLGACKLVTSIHGSDVLLNGTREGIPSTGVNAMFTASDMVVAPSNGFQSAVRAVWPKARDCQMVTIPNGIDPAELGYDASAGETALEPPYIQSILQLISYKGPDVLLRAFAEMYAAYPGLRLRLIGDGPMRAECETLAQSLGIASHVDFLGFRDRKFVGEALRGCSVFVLPSLTNSESFGIVVAEAMALDRAVIGSNIGGLPELIDHERTGLLVPPGDVKALAAALTRLMSDYTLRTRLGQTAGQQVRQNRLWKNAGQQYVKLLFDVRGS